MKLFLASNGGFLIERGYDLLGIAKFDMHIGYVTTASKGVENLQYLETHKQAMREAGYAFEEIDIEGKTKEELREAFYDKDAVYVEGGNTFYLLKAIRGSGFSDVLRELMLKGFIYIGVSAGAYVATPSIEPATWSNRSNFSYYGLTDFFALGLVPFCLFAHYNTYSADKQKMIQERARALGYPVRLLRDGQGILVQDGVATFVGEGEEVKL